MKPSRVKGFRLIFCCSAILAAATACASSAPIQPGAVVVQPDPALGQQGYSHELAEGYQLRAGDTVSVRVFGEDDLSLDSVRVSADGFVSIPLIGPVRLSGLTIAQAQDQMAQMLSARFLRDPQVAVNVLQYGSHVVTVEGSVETPGLYQFMPGTRLSGGIALAEGVTRVSDLGEVAIFRTTPGGMEVAKFDYREVRAGRMLDPVLMPGDRIVVGTDGLSQFYQDALQAVPIFALFTRI